MNVSANDARAGDVLYSDDRREVGFIASVTATEIAVLLDAEFGIHQLIRLDKSRMDCTRSTLLLPMPWAQKAVGTRLLHLSVD